MYIIDNEQYTRYKQMKPFLSKTDIIQKKIL